MYCSFVCLFFENTPYSWIHYYIDIVSRSINHAQHTRAEDKEGAVMRKKIDNIKTINISIHSFE